MTLHSSVFARSWPTTMTRRLVLPPLKQWWGITMDSSTPTQWSVKRALGWRKSPNLSRRWSKLIVNDQDIRPVLSAADR